MENFIFNLNLMVEVEVELEVENLPATSFITRSVYRTYWLRLCHSFLRERHC